MQIHILLRKVLWGLTVRYRAVLVHMTDTTGRDSLCFHKTRRFWLYLFVSCLVQDLEILIVTVQVVVFLVMTPCNDVVGHHLPEDEGRMVL
jgi:hypothetical protein